MAYCIEEYTGASPRVDNNTIQCNMPTLLIGVVVVDVPSPCCESMIAFPDEEHLPNKICKIQAILELDIELCTGFLPKRVLGSHNRGGTGRSTGTSLKVDTYIIRTPSRYPITNSYSKRCISTSLIGWTRMRPLKRHKGIEKWHLLVGLLRRRWITPLEFFFCDLQSSSSHTTWSVLYMAKTVTWQITTAVQKYKQEKTSWER